MLRVDCLFFIHDKIVLHSSSLIRTDITYNFKFSFSRRDCRFQEYEFYLFRIHIYVYYTVGLLINFFTRNVLQMVNQCLKLEILSNISPSLWGKMRAISSQMKKWLEPTETGLNRRMLRIPLSEHVSFIENECKQ